MKKIRKVLICGLGAIGSIYATALKRCPDIELKILVDSNRYHKYQNSPIIFNGVEQSFDYILPETTNYIPELIIIATKNNALDKIIPNIKNFVGKETLILSLLNGLKSEEVIAQTYGKDRVIDSYYIGHTSTRKDRTVTHDGIYKTVFGDPNNNALTDRVESIKHLFDKANIPYEIPMDMLYSKWWKFLVNVGYNQASVLLNAPYKDFQKNEKVNNIAINLMQEAALIAKAEGVKNTEQFIPEILEVIKNMLPETKTSMLQDIEAKRETEIDVFAGYILELAKKHNIETPYNKIAYEIIKAMDSKLNQR